MIDLKNPKVWKIADHYGLSSQIDKLAEECGELSEAVNENIPFMLKEEYLVEEMADVLVMINQIAILTHTENCLDAMINYKIERQLHRIDCEERGKRSDK